MGVEQPPRQLRLTLRQDAPGLDLTVLVRDLTPEQRDSSEKGHRAGRGKTLAFGWKRGDQSELAFRDAKSALLDHVESIRLLHALDGEAVLARDEQSGPEAMCLFALCAVVPGATTIQTSSARPTASGTNPSTAAASASELPERSNTLSLYIFTS